MSSRTAAGRAVAHSGARRTQRLAARLLAAAAALTLVSCSAGPSSTTSGSSSASSGRPTAEGVGGTAASALIMAAARMRRIRSYTATYSITTAGASTPSLTGTVAWQNRPAVLADEKSFSHVGSIPLPGGVETIIDRDVVYIRISALSKMLGKPWIKIDAASLSSTASALAPVVQSLAPNLLAEAQLFAASSNAPRAGTQVINGVPTTEYAGTSTIAAGLSHLSPSLRQLIVPGLSSMRARTSHFTIWIDGQHIMRKEVTTQRVRRGTVTLTVVVTSINHPVAVHVPPASQVAVVPGL